MGKKVSFVLFFILNFAIPPPKNKQAAPMASLGVCKHIVCKPSAYGFQYLRNLAYSSHRET